MLLPQRYRGEGEEVFLRLMQQQVMLLLELVLMLARTLLLVLVWVLHNRNPRLMNYPPLWYRVVSHRSLHHTHVAAH